MQSVKSFRSLGLQDLANQINFRLLDAKQPVVAALALAWEGQAGGYVALVCYERTTA